jgi:RNA polymerase primary sigma factor
MTANISSGTGNRRDKALSFLREDDPLAAYYNDIKRNKSLTLAEEQALAARIQQGDRQAINALVQANLRFVVAVCRNYRHQGLSMGDLINEGNLGLIRAARKFDASLNFKFISYAVWWIRQAILTALAEQSRPLNISAGRITAMQRVGKASRKLEQRLGRQPLLGEVAEAMGKTEMEITECVQLGSASLSLSSPIPGDPGSTLMDCMQDENAQKADAGARQFLLSGSMQEAIAGLDDREAKILRMYYGFGGKATRTLREIADHLGITRERVRQIKAGAIQRLRHPSRVRKLAAFQC